MRALTIIGLLLVLGGGYALLTGGVVTRNREVLDVGGVRVSAQETRSVAPWVAGLVLVIGGGLIAAGVSRKS
jgi:hypothetical protein